MEVTKVIPRRLRPGDRIGIVSPSSPVTQEREEQFTKGLDFLDRLGLRCVIGSHVRSNTLGYAASPPQKAGDINRMFADPDINAIICTQGGVTANACLSFLDWDVIAGNPKIFAGISDITVLLNAIYTKTGLVTFHGNDLLWGFGRNPTPYDRSEFVRQLMDGCVGDIPAAGIRKTVRGGVAQGPLVGGNISCLLKLAGTKYLPGFGGAVLFLEAIGISPEVCDHSFHQLKHIGVFDQIKGVLIGHIDGMENHSDMIQMEDILNSTTLEFDFPILKVADFGHNCPNTYLPVGATVRMDADNQRIEVVSQCLA
jgi:muramoyltetrapeptide carboxypeptidase